MYQVNESNLEKLILQFKKLLNAVDQSGLSEIGLRNILKLTKEEVQQGHKTIEVIKEELKLFRAEG